MATIRFRERVRTLALGLFCVFSPTFYSQAQKIELKYTELVDQHIVIHYNLHDSIEGRSYTVRLYSSADGFLNPLEKITGDVGLEVKSGMNRKIVWTGREELGASFAGKVALEIRARLFIPFINTGSIDKYKVFKRARKYNLTWSGGSPQNVLNFDVVKVDKQAVTFANLANVGHGIFEFPSHVRPGKNYRFRISDAKNKDEVVFSQPFAIKRKIPLLLKAIPVMAIASVAYLIVASRHTVVDPPIGDPSLPPQ